MDATDSTPTLTLEAAMVLRFPPFPAVPDGVEIVPFHSFRPSGIRVPIDDDDDDVDGFDGRVGGPVSEEMSMIERDGLGIPTISLRVKHVTDNLEKKKKRKKRAGVAAQQVQVAPEKLQTWWELWEELEEIRRNAYDVSVPPRLRVAFPALNERNRNLAAIDRLYQAGVDFKSGRTWPTATQGVQHVWDIVRHVKFRCITVQPNCSFFAQFRIYIGLLQQTPAPPKDSAPDADTKSDDSDADSDAEDADVALAAADDEANLMEAFLSDPELSMKIFFSSHFRERGLIW
jgi:hypothetical protein